MLAGYGALSFQRAQLFQDQVVLFRHVLATNAAAHEAGHILGTFLLEREQWHEAEQVYTAALRRTPDAIKIHANLGSVLMQLGRVEEAVQLLRQGVALEAAQLRDRRDHGEARHETAAVRVNLGLALMKLHRLAEAEHALRRALELAPAGAEARHNLAVVLQRQAVESFHADHLADALRLFRESIALNPADAQSHANMGAALGRLGRYREAAQSFQRALRLDPDNQSARAGLELARQKTGGD